MTYLFAFFLLVSLFLSVWNLRLRRKIAVQLQIIGKMPLSGHSYWQCRSEEMETELVIERTRLAEIEKFLSLGILAYSHTVGICVKNDPEKCCVPLDEAILRNLAKEVSEK